MCVTKMKKTVERTSVRFLSYQNLYQQYIACRKRKRNTFNALQFEMRQELNLLELLEALQNHSYQPARSVCFIATKPKLREIFAADFRDRVVHHLLVSYLEPDWERIFIYDSYACRKNKGIHAAVTRLQKFMRQVSANGQRPAWYLQMDIHNFFMSIDKTILLKILTPRINHPDVLWLTDILVNHDCTENFVFKGRKALLEQVPEHKSLRYAPKDKGLPIGNLNSQCFANVYLNKLDQFVKHQLKCQYFLRYCDDFVLLSADKNQLVVWRKKIEAFLYTELGLSLNTRREKSQHISSGVDFLGYIVRQEYLLPRRRVVNQLRQKLVSYQKQLIELRANYTIYHFNYEVLEQCRATLASYWGHLLHADSFCLRQRLLVEFPFLEHYFIFFVQGEIAPLFVIPKGYKTVRQQYYYFRWRFPDDVLLFQVGRFYEFYHSADDDFAETLGLKRMRLNRRDARYGFPAFQLMYFQQLILQSGMSMLVIRETNEVCIRVKQRVPCYRLIIRSKHFISTLVLSEAVNLKMSQEIIGDKPRLNKE